MLLPIRTDRRLTNTPWVNVTLIVANVLTFLLTGRGVMFDDSMLEWMLTPADPRPWQFITYQFLHADLYHLAGNMLFLWVFGNSVEDRLGKLGYLGFYLTGGILAGLGQAVLDPTPILGASGSIAAVTGAYLALFPQSQVTIFYFFIIFGTFEISSMLLILLHIGYDIFFFLGRSTGVAYLAHLAGYGFGLLVGLALLWTRLLPREPFDLLSMMEQRRRRAQFAALVREGYRPWEGDVPGEPAAARPMSPREQQVSQLRAQISSAMATHNLDQASATYLSLLELEPGQVMPQQAQLDLANHLAGQGRHQQAAVAYELLLKSYRAQINREQIELMLGVIYARYLDQPQRSAELLNAALPRLSDPDQRQLARDILQSLSS